MTPPVRDESVEGRAEGMKSKEPVFEYDEDKLSLVSGVAVGHLQSARTSLLKKGADWTLHGGSVLLTLQGVLAVLGGIGFPMKKKGAKLAAALDGALLNSLPAAGVVRVRVTALPRNTALVVGENMNAGGMCRVVVGDSVNFTHGMELKAQPMDGADPDVFVLVGPRPRARGRW